ncbi:MAG TPA: M48 family metalloprotease [Rhodocyclaceae bacterium]
MGFSAKKSVLLLAVLMAGCATTSPTGRTQWVAPTSVSALYSKIDMTSQLVLEPDGTACGGQRCETQQSFQTRVQLLGERLNQVALRAYPDLEKRGIHFRFEVLQKRDPVTLSNAAGDIVISDGVRALELDNAALAFVLAREMGHVVGSHHEENSATSIAFSAVGYLLLPTVNLLRGAAAAILPTTGTAVATTAATMAGSRVMRSTTRPEQRREADMIARALFTGAGGEPFDLPASLARSSDKLGKDSWAEELRESTRYSEQLACGPSPTLRPPGTSEGNGFEQAPASATVSMAKTSAASTLR